ncbi:NUDIX hydrolase [Agarilytica rhodophyticola]|uniref:NUDIX hydrolase n=1 Tax=Agarilytica rhodophyticola TaxID=1737490 RepID=UPI000B3466B6|nr:NUDIX domain-containing protein [Agarilytica rhodophyticola]
MIDNDLRQIIAITPEGKHRPIAKLQAHQEGIHHLAISVFIFSGHSMLIQRRADTKYHSAGLWANACCSHPDWNESPEDCASRRVDEELGVTLHLEHIGIIDYKADVGDGLIESEKVHMFIAEVDANALNLQLNEQEISAVRWINIEKLEKELKQTPELFAAWFHQYMSRQDPPFLHIRDRMEQQ